MIGQENLTPAELKSALNQALLRLEQQENDLQAAARIGAELVEANRDLTAKIEQLSHQGERKLQKKKSMDVFCLVADLEKENRLLTAKLEEALTLLHSNDSAQMAQLTHLRNTNVQLQEELRFALKDRKESEKKHGKVVASLEGHLDQLKTDLVSLTAENHRLDRENRKLKEAVTGTQEEPLADYQLQKVDELIERISSLEQELVKERSNNQQSLQINQDIVLKEQEHALELAKECEHYKQLVMEQRETMETLQEQLESERNNQPTVEKKPWVWSNWVDRSWAKIMDIDLTGLREEVNAIVD
jgi:hypothetical protein